jgi:hypothetical protein
MYLAHEIRQRVAVVVAKLHMPKKSYGLSSCIFMFQEMPRISKEVKITERLQKIGLIVQEKNVMMVHF